ENWEFLENRLGVTKRIFHSNYSSLPFDINLQGGEINDDDLLTEKIALKLALEREQAKQNQLLIVMTLKKLKNLNKKILEKANKK
ncbi:8484_t:CDS:2, partial [Scutellospora calospora]